jgi:iron complex outermembrane receptor protein
MRLQNLTKPMEKPMIKNVLIKFGFVRIALLASVGFPLLFAFNAFAQNPAPPPPPPGAAAAPAPAAAEVERVIVTGSNIPTAEEVGPNPVFSLNRDLINKSGQGSTVEQFLKTQPVMSASSVPLHNNGVAQGGPAGSASASLRGFEPAASLVLWDGRRVAPFAGAAGTSANSGGAFVDLISLPIFAVQSIEILKDGASTTYGADAVAGVINLKPYKDYRGAQITIQYGDSLTDNGPKGFKTTDEAEYRGDLLFGTGNETTSITGDIFYYKHHSMFNRDRTNSLVPPFLSSNSSPYNLQLSSDVAGAAGGENLNPGGLEFATAPDFTNGLAPASSYLYNAKHRVRSSSGQLPGFNFNATSGSFPEQERWGGYGAFEHKICDDQLRIFGDFFYVDAKTHDENAPSASGDWITPGNPTLFIPPNHPLPIVNGVTVTPPNTPTAAEVGMPNGAFNPFNPFEQIISGGTRSRFADFGNRLVDNENIAELFTVGVKGDKLFNGTWGYDGAFRFSQFQQIFQIQDVNAQRFNRIMNANDPLFDPNSAQFIGQTIPYDPFNDFRRPIASNQPLIDFATLRLHSLATMKEATLDLNIYTTDLFDLPAGGVGLAFGGVFTRQEYTFNPDDQARLGEEVGVGLTPPARGGRKEYALYAETLIPIFSPKWNIPGFHSLEFSAGVRYESWLNNDTNAAVPKVGLRWQPFDESLTIRSTWGEGFVEPSLNQLFGPTVFGLGPAHFTGFAPVSKFGPPNNPQHTNDLQDFSQPELTTVQLPNKNLHPEHDRAWTGGLVYTPKWIPSKWGELTLTVDFWDVERTGVVMSLSPQTIIAGYNAGIFPGIVSPQQPQIGQVAALFSSTGEFNGVAAPFLNGGRMRANGVDLGLQYQIETGIGTFSSLTRVTYLNEFVVNFPGERPFQVAGRINADWWEGLFFGQATGGDGWYKWKGMTNLDWTWHNIDLNATVHLLDGFWEEIFAAKFDGVFKQHYIHPTWFTDVQASYSLIFTPPVEAAPVPGYSKGGKEVVGKEKETPPVPYAMPCWKNILNNTTLTVGVNNIFDKEPPHAFGYGLGNANGYPAFGDYDNIGRFWYVRLIKKF